MDKNTNNGDINIEDIEENFKNQLIEEEYINNLLSGITLKKPYNSFDLFIKEKFNSNDAFNKNNEINNNNNSNLKNYQNLWNSLTDNQKQEYKNEYIKKNNKYKRDIEIIRKYIFKGIDGKIKFKSTAYQIYLNDQLIEGLEKNYDPKYIKNNARLKWNKMKLEDKKPYFLKKKENDTILDLVLKYKNINPFILYVFNYLNNCKKNNNIIPNINKLTKNWENLNNSEKQKYEKYAEELIYDKYNIRNIYDAIHGIKPKTPSGALRIFLQIKAAKKEINTINEGINLWNNLNINEKEYYLKISHKYYLSFKYKEMIYNKKIKKNYPKKPISPFQIYLNDKKGIKLPKGNNNPILYWRKKYNELTDTEKDKYKNIFNKNVIEYKKKLESMKNKIFDFPKSPTNPFTFYIKSEFMEESKKSPNFNVKEYFEILTKNWYENKINKNKYEDMANENRKRYKNEIIQFQKFGYYTKYNIYNKKNYIDEDANEKSESAPKIKKKSVSNYNSIKTNNKNKKSFSTNNKNHNNNNLYYLKNIFLIIKK